MMPRWLGTQVVFLGEVGSTNDVAGLLAREGVPHGTVVVATSQAAGRGRQGRSWFSPPDDNLYLSLVLRLDLAPALVPPLTLAVGVGVHAAVSSLGTIAPSLKWPNDVLIGGRKVAGILAEMTTRGSQVEACIVGIGINVNTQVFPPDLQDRATSLAIALGRRLMLEEVRDAVLASLEPWIDRFLYSGARAIIPAWKAASDMMSRRAAVSADGEVLQGVAVDVDEDGALWLELDSGRRVSVVAGEVVVQ